MEPQRNQATRTSQIDWDKDKLEALQKCINKQLTTDAWEGHIGKKIMRLLINGEVDARDEAGRTPLMLAASKGYDEICGILIDSTAQIDAQERDGSTPLMTAVHYGQTSICELLLNKKAQVDAIDSDGCTAAHYAAIQKRASICKLLLDNGARVDIKDENGETPLIDAVKSVNWIIIKTLITCPIFSPFLSEDEFQSSRQRILAALCAFRRTCPSLPKDMRKQILNSLPELKKDALNAGIFGNFKNLKEEQTPHVPLPLVQLLIERRKLNPEMVVAAIKAHHLLHISPMMFVAIPYAHTPAARALIHPDNLEKNFDFEIEWNIRRRLGLLTWPEKAIDSCTQKLVGWILKYRCKYQNKEIYEL